EYDGLESALKLAKRTDLFTYEWIKLEAVVPTQVKQRGLEVTRDKGYQKLILKSGTRIVPLRRERDRNSFNEPLGCPYQRDDDGKAVENPYQAQQRLQLVSLLNQAPPWMCNSLRVLVLVLSFLGYKHLQVPRERNTAA
ncbi:hypothetical protein H0E87_004444, partial [Populus deltoides]